MDTKVLVLDIDGTLTNSQKEITPNTKQGIKNIQERGHIVILASGRPTPGMKRYAEELELEQYGGYLLSFNGGRIINCRTGEIVYQKIIPAAVIPAHPQAVLPIACCNRAQAKCLPSMWATDNWIGRSVLTPG